MTVKVVIGT